jgi:hypothetical protein
MERASMSPDSFNQYTVHRTQNNIREQIPKSLTYFPDRSIIILQAEHELQNFR